MSQGQQSGRRIQQEIIQGGPQPNVFSVSLSNTTHAGSGEAGNLGRWQVTPCCGDPRVWSAQAFSGWGGLWLE